MLDPSQRSLGSVQGFLAEHNWTAVELLSRAVLTYTYVGDMESQATLAGDESSANDGDLSAADKVRWKRAKLDLLAKHVVSAPTRDIDIQQYRCLNMSPDDAHSSYTHGCPC